MMKISWIVFFLLIHSINSNSFDQNDCSLCQFDDYFNRLNGYGCFRKSDNETICTCPDRRLSTMNQPCRICHRTDICGTQTDMCSEQSFVTIPTKERSYFTCFCASGSVSINEKCPEEITIDSNTTTASIGKTTNIINTTNILEISSTTSNKENNTVSTKNSTTTITPTVTKCKDNSSSSHLYMKPMLIILLNLVYFVNK